MRRGCFSPCRPLRIHLECLFLWPCESSFRVLSHLQVTFFVSDGSGNFPNSSFFFSASSVEVKQSEPKSTWAPSNSLQKASLRGLFCVITFRGNLKVAWPYFYFEVHFKIYHPVRFRRVYCNRTIFITVFLKYVIFGNRAENDDYAHTKKWIPKNEKNRMQGLRMYHMLKSQTLILLKLRENET